MGNEPPKKQYNPKQEKLRLEIVCIKVKSYLELNRDRKIAEVNQKEQTLFKMVNHSSRNKQDEVFKISSIVTDINYVEGCNIIIRFADIIKDRSLQICEAKGKPDTIADLMSMIESILWASKAVNLASL